MQNIHSPMRTALWSLVVLTVIAFVFGAAYQFEQWRVMRQGKSQLLVQAASMDTLFQQYAVTPRLLMTDPRLITLLRGKGEVGEANNQEANAILKNAAGVGNLAEVFLMDERGVTVAASNSETEVSFVGKSYGFRPYFQGAIQGEQTTFFGVGATTGIPGYFIANPLYLDGLVIGVVVAKVGPQQLPTLWREKPEEVFLTDELGVVLLASTTELLYVPTMELSPASFDIVASERRYSVSETQRFEKRSDNGWSLHSGDTQIRNYIAISESLRTEAWQLTAMVPSRSVLWRALQYLLALLAVALIVTLFISRQRQQKQLILINDRYAKDLELLVQEKTLELETTRDALIAESNFAMLGRMSAAINHEINQPLASLRFNLATLRQTIEGNAQTDDEIREIVIDSDRTTKRIGRVVETLRSVARYHKVPSAIVNLRLVIQEVSETVKRERPQMYRCLTVNSGVDSAHVHGSAVLIQQAVLNLLYNAFDAVLRVQKPSVALELSRHRDKIVITVTDNGIGVSEDMIDRLFHPFESSLQETSGKGLGLALAKQIVNDHGGHIVYQAPVAHAQLEPSGSVFIISMPCSDSQQRSSDRPGVNQ